MQTARLPAAAMRALPTGLDHQLLALLAGLATDLPAILQEDLVGVYLWGSLTFGAFDPRSSDVDLVVVTARDIDDPQLARLQAWFDEARPANPWAARCDVRLVIAGELLDRDSRCCLLEAGRFVRTGSDGTPFLCLNLRRSGITLLGQDARAVAPEVSPEQLRDGLLRELAYLSDGLVGDADPGPGSAPDEQAAYAAYAVLTACRILYTACHGTLVSKRDASLWASTALPIEWRRLILAAGEGRLDAACDGPGLSSALVLGFVRAVEARVRDVATPAGASRPSRGRR